MSGINFFTWLRDGVRQSVMLGVSDAIEQLGTPAAADDLHPSVVGFLRADKAVPGEQHKIAASSLDQDKSRKRLGRSLKEIEAQVQK